MMNLNCIAIPVALGDGYPEVKDNSCLSLDGNIAVYFRDLESRLIELINQSTVVVGCVAWLTNHNILDALRKASWGVSLVVQKEDFLRPDVNPVLNWKTKLRKAYGRLSWIAPRGELVSFVGSMSYLSGDIDEPLDPVRCMGNYNRDRHPAFPRMHNKFLVFCNHQQDEDKDGNYRLAITPHTVWTGSFNLTENATMSLENAVVIKDSKISLAYFREWEQILALSEPLDWDSDWCSPEWRIGS